MDQAFPCNYFYTIVYIIKVIIKSNCNKLIVKGYYDDQTSPKIRNIKKFREKIDVYQDKLSKLADVSQGLIYLQLFNSDPVMPICPKTYNLLPFNRNINAIQTRLHPNRYFLLLSHNDLHL